MDTDRSGTRANLRIGTCSWKYPSWEGLVYSSAEPENHLAEYARHFDTVEVDQWFWSLFENSPVAMPRDLTVREYEASVPGDFLFTVKVPNSITLTHFYGKKGGDGAPDGAQGDHGTAENPHFLSEPLFKAFLEKLAPIQKKTGVLMFQFEYLSKEKMSGSPEFIGKLEPFFSSVPRLVPMALEPRNKSYLNSDWFQFLNRNSLYHVFLQGYYMPPVADVYERYGKYIRDLAVIRLHGYDREDMEHRSAGKWDRLFAPKDAELDRIVPMIRDLLSRDIRVFVNVNNHYEGSAPLTIEKIRKRLEDS